MSEAEGNTFESAHLSFNKNHLNTLYIRGQRVFKLDTCLLMSVRLERGRHVVGLRTSALRSIVHGKPKRQMNQSKRSQRKPLGGQESGLVTINVDMGVEEAVLMAEPELASKPSGGFLQGAGALNSIMLIVITVILLETKEPNGCMVEWYYGTSISGANTTGSSSLHIGSTNLVYGCLVINTIIGLYPIWIAYAVPSEHQGVRKRVKNVMMLCLITILMTLKVGQSAVLYQLLQLCALLSVWCGARITSMTQSLYLLMACIVIGTASAVAPIGKRMGVAIWIWWILGALLFIGPKTWSNQAFRITTDVSMGLQMIIVWILVMECWS